MRIPSTRLDISVDVRERKKTRVSGVTHHHRILWSAADRLIQEADEPPEGKWYGYMAGLLLSFEGLLNYIGEELYPEEWAGEKAFFGQDPYRGTAGKLLFLSERLAVPIDRSRRPYQSFRRLSKFRDEMVHVRQEKVDTEVVTSLEEIGRESHIPPIVARESVHRIRADLEDLGNRLFHGARAGGLEVNKDWTAFRGSVSVRAYHDIPSEMVVLSKLKADGSSSLRRSRVTPERASNPGDRVPAGSWQVGVPFSSRRRSSVG